jgi:hypothetical protein
MKINTCDREATPVKDTSCQKSSALAYSPWSSVTNSPVAKELSAIDILANQAMMVSDFAPKKSVYEAVNMV